MRRPLLAGLLVGATRWCGVAYGFNLFTGPGGRSLGQGSQPPRAVTLPTTAPLTWAPPEPCGEEVQGGLPRPPTPLTWPSRWSSGNRAKDMLKAFNNLRVTYGWCYSPQDAEALEALGRELEVELSYITDPVKLARVGVALQVAYHCHLGQKRKSGEPFVHHPVAVAKILAQLRMDVDSIVAGLLHDTVEDTSLSISDIEAVFGPSVRRLVEGETKVSKLPRRVGPLEGSAGAAARDKQAENLRHLILAMSEDWRVLVIKLSDRLHNMRTLGAMPLVKQERTARETLDVFVPLAAKLGVWDIKTELEDLALRILYPEKHAALTGMIDARLGLLGSLWTNKFGGARMTMGQAITDALPRLLKEHEVVKGRVDNIDVRVRGKKVYEAWKQSPEPDEADSQADLITVQVVVSAKGRRGAPTSMEEAEAERMLCYRVLEALHKVLPARDPSANFRDFVRYPRDNGYQALHSLVDLQGFPYPIEVHVCTEWMDEVARYGLLAAWARSGSYGADEQGQGGAEGEGEAHVPLELPWLQAINAFTQSVVGSQPSVSAQHLIDSIKAQLTVRRLVITREGEILNLESPDGEVTARDLVLARGSRPVLGVDPEGLVVRVNGRPVALSKPLRHGDVVDFVTRPYRASRGRANRPKAAATRRQGPKGIEIWPWCLLGNEDSAPARQKVLGRMWGVRGAVRLAGQDGKARRAPAFDSGEVVWLREAEKRHGRLSIALLAYWALSPLVTSLASGVGGALGGAETLDAALGITRGPWVPMLPVLTGPQAFAFVCLVGAFELFGSILPRTFERARIRARGEHGMPGVGEAGPVEVQQQKGSVVAIGVRAAASVGAIVHALKQSELTVGRVSMVGVVSVLCQALILMVLGKPIL